MEWVAQAGLSNAAAATLLAVLAALVGFAVRRPALTHGLWLLVLVKLVTPPVAPVALRWTSDAPRPVPKAIVPRPEWTVVADDPPVAAAVVDVSNGTLATVWYGLLAAWGAGALGWWILAGWRIVRFRQMLREMRPGDEALTALVETLAARLGLAHCPRVGVVPGRVPPLVWSIGARPCVVLPDALWGTLEPEARESLLIHELAHLRRRDHWTRWLEILTGGLYWWFPVAWWARRALREAEEQCCDAWVVAARPESARAYAGALLATLDFLSEPRPATPLAASGIGPVSCLKRRMTMIIRAETSKSLSWRGRLAVLTLGATLLPIAPTWAQREQDEPSKDAPAPREPSTREQIERYRHAFEALGFVDEDVKEQIDKAFSWVERAVELGQLSEEGMSDALDQAGRDLDRSLKRARAAERDRREDDAARDKARAESPERRAELDRARAEIRELHDKLRLAEKRIADLEQRGGERARDGAGERPTGTPARDGVDKRSFDRPTTPRAERPAPENRDQPNAMRPGRRGGPGSADRDPTVRGRELPRITPPERNLERRMRELEEKIDALLKDKQDREKERQDPKSELRERERGLKR